MITSDVENYPGYADGIMGPEMMADFRRQAERFGADFVTDDVTKVDFSERPFRIWVENDEYRARAVIVATGASARWLGLAVRAAAPGPRRLGLRHLRRRLLQGEGARRRRRRRHGDGGGELPHPLRDEGDGRPPARRVPRLADHARPRPRQPEDRVRDERRRRGHPRRDDGRGVRLRDTRTGETSELDDRRRLRRDRPRPEHGAVRRPARPRRRTATSSPSPARPRRTSRASSPPATCRTTSTGRRSPPPAPAAWRRSTPSASSPPTRAHASARRACPPGDACLLLAREHPAYSSRDGLRARALAAPTAHRRKGHCAGLPDPVLDERRAGRARRRAQGDRARVGRRRRGRPLAGRAGQRPAARARARRRRARPPRLDRDRRAARAARPRAAALPRRAGRAAPRCACSSTGSTGSGSGRRT